MLIPAAFIVFAFASAGQLWTLAAFAAGLLALRLAGLVLEGAFWLTRSWPPGPALLFWVFAGTFAAAAITQRYPLP